MDRLDHALELIDHAPPEPPARDTGKQQHAADRPHETRADDRLQCAFLRDVVTDQQSVAVSEIVGTSAHGVQILVARALRAEGEFRPTGAAAGVLRPFAQVSGQHPAIGCEQGI